MINRCQPLPWGASWVWRERLWVCGNSQSMCGCKRGNPCVEREVLGSLLSVHPFSCGFLDHFSLIILNWQLEAQRWPVLGWDTQPKLLGYCASLETSPELLVAYVWYLMMSSAVRGTHMPCCLLPKPAGCDPVCSSGQRLGQGGGQLWDREGCLRIMGLWLPWWGVLKLVQSSSRCSSVQDNMYHKGEKMGQVERALNHEVEDTDSSPEPGHFVNWKWDSVSSPVTGRFILDDRSLQMLGCWEKISYEPIWLLPLYGHSPLFINHFWVNWHYSNTLWQNRLQSNVKISYSWEIKL